MAVTKEQLTEVCEKLFKEIDKNGNGKLEKEEVRDFTSKTMKVIKPDAEFNEDEFETNFKDLDTNNDGLICK